MASVPNFFQVEAMHNLGSIMETLGRNYEAYEWWWKAVQLRPNYWDALVRLQLICK